MVRSKERADVRIPWLSVLTRMVCNSLLISGGMLMGGGAIYDGSRTHWMTLYGVICVTIALLTTCSRRQPARRMTTILLVMLLVEVGTIMLFVVLVDKLSPSILVAIGLLAAWPTLGLLWLVLDCKARQRMKQLGDAPTSHGSWKQTLTRGGLYVLVPILLLGYGYWYANMPRSILTQAASHSWSQTTGTIRWCEVVPCEDSLCRTSDFHMLYTYQVDGKPYRGTRYNAFDPGSFTWEDFARTHPAGTSVTVHYDASDPGTSLLQEGFDAYLYLMLLGVLWPIGWLTVLCWWLVDIELRRMLPADAYKRSDEVDMPVAIAWIGGVGFFSMIISSTFWYLTDLAPAAIDTIAAWVVVLAGAWLMYRLLQRLELRQQAEKQAAAEPLLGLA